MIYECVCQHEYQDKLYGKGRRVWNPLGVQGKSGIRCTVCKRENTSVIAKVDKEKAPKGKSSK